MKYALLKLKSWEEGLAVPDVGTYYYAAILVSMMQWWDLSNTLSWHWEQIGATTPLSELTLLLGTTLNHQNCCFKGYGINTSIV